MKATQIDLKSVKINGVGLEASYVYDNKELKAKGKEPIHDDLRNAVKKLTPYLMEVCEMSEAENIDWNNLEGSITSEACLKFGVGGITISGSEAQLSVTISGFKLLKTNKTLFFNTPRVFINLENEDHYERCEELREIVQDICFEAEAYIINHKYAVYQQELPFKDDDGEGEDPFNGEGE